MLKNLTNYGIETGNSSVAQLILVAYTVKYNEDTVRSYIYLKIRYQIFAVFVTAQNECGYNLPLKP